MSYHFLKIILEFISNITWPIVGFSIVFIFRNELKIFLTKIKSVALGGTTFNTIQEGQQDSSVSTMAVPESMKMEVSSETIAMANEILEIESEVEMLNNDTEKYIRLKQYSGLLIVSNLFRDIYYIIYGSQIKLLLYLNSNGSNTKDSLKRFYDTAVAEYSFMYDNYSYEEYCQWLINKQLIIVTGENVQITTTGRDFLKFLIKYGYQIDKAY